jgi:hypothetical protein
MKNYILLFALMFFAFGQSQNSTISGTDSNSVESQVASVLTIPGSDAPTPPSRETLDVISIFSDSYNNISGANYNPNWQQSGFGTANPAFQPTGSGNAVLAYPNFNYQGIEFNSDQDITVMEFLHLDIWTVDGVIPSISVISSGTELPKTITNGDGAWQSIEIPVAGITGDLIKVIQLKFTGGNGASNAIYVDNLYFWKEPSLRTNDFEILNFKAFPNPSETSWTIKTDNDNITSIKVFDVLGKNVVSLFPNTIETVIDGSTLKAGLYVAQIKTVSGVKIMKLIKE